MFVQYGKLGTAVYSDNRFHRYVLTRLLGPPHGKTTMVIGLNPSTATADQNDPTVRRCVGFTETFGCSLFCMTNAFAFRSTKPLGLLDVSDPVGPENDAELVRVAKTADVIVLAWGTHSNAKLRNLIARRGAEVVRLLSGHKLMCLGRNRDGSPKHPLYLRADTKPIEWKRAA
jgi:hypothetical protein